MLITCPNPEVGEAIARVLVEERLAACVNLLPAMTSIYHWEGRLCRDPESLLIVKTRRGRFTALGRRVKTLHPYSVPEIIALPIAAGSAPYLAWVKRSSR